MKRKGDYRRQVEKLIDDAEGLPHGRSQVDLLEEAVALADSHQDEDLAYSTRFKLVEACLMASDDERMLVAFAWRLAHHDRDPDRFPEHEILWEFRWVVSSLTRFPDVSRAKIDEMQSDMAARYMKAGVSPRPFALMCRKMAIDMGDRARADEMNQWYRRSYRDWMCDGVATEIAFEVTYRQFRREYAKSLRVAAPLLDGRVKDKFFLPITRADVLMPLLRAGRLSEAMAIQGQSYRKLRGDASSVDSSALHISFLALTGNSASATRILDRHLLDALSDSCRFTKFWFIRESLVLLDRLIRDRKSTIKVRLPKGCPIAAVKGQNPVVELRTWLFELALGFGERFDERNGNSYYVDRLNEVPKLQRLYKQYQAKS